MQADDVNIDQVELTTDDAITALDFSTVEEFQKFASAHGIAPRPSGRWPAGTVRLDLCGPMCIRFDISRRPTAWLGISDSNFGVKSENLSL